MKIRYKFRTKAFAYLKLSGERNPSAGVPVSVNKKRLPLEIIAFCFPAFPSCLAVDTLSVCTSFYLRMQLSVGKKDKETEAWKDYKKAACSLVFNGSSGSRHSQLQFCAEFKLISVSGSQADPIWDDKVGLVKWVRKENKCKRLFLWRMSCGVSECFSL